MKLGGSFILNMYEVIVFLVIIIGIMKEIKYVGFIDAVY